MNLNRWIDKITYRIPLSIYEMLIPRDLVGLFYHSISDELLPIVQYLYDIKTEAMFERDLIYIKKYHTPLSYQQIEDYANGKHKLTSDAIFISFDDGFQECFSIVRPLLKLHDIPCTFFITTNFIDNKILFYRHKVSLAMEKIRKFGAEFQEKIFSKVQNSICADVNNLPGFDAWIKSLTMDDENIIDEVCGVIGIDVQKYLRDNTPYMTHDQIKCLAEDGFTIGAHSMSHRLLSDLNFDELEREITGSCRIIQEITKTDRIPFAFPFYGHQINKTYLKIIQDRNQEVGLFFDTNGIRESSKYGLNRIWADSPEWDQNEKSNVQSLIHLAYRDQLITRLRRIGLYK